MAVTARESGKLPQHDRSRRCRRCAPESLAEASPCRVLRPPPPWSVRGFLAAATATAVGIGVKYLYDGMTGSCAVEDPAGQGNQKRQIEEKTYVLSFATSLLLQQAISGLERPAQPYQSSWNQGWLAFQDPGYLKGLLLGAGLTYL